MSFLWSLILAVHLVAATFWVGGQLMLVFVMMPVLRRTLAPPALGQAAALTGRRFAKVSNYGLFPTLVVTGIAMAGHDGVRLSMIGTTSFTRVLAVKIVVVVIVIALALGHGTAAKRLSRRGARALALITVALSVLIVALAAALVVLPSP